MKASIVDMWLHGFFPWERKNAAAYFADLLAQEAHAQRLAEAKRAVLSLAIQWRAESPNGRNPPRGSFEWQLAEAIDRLAAERGKP